MFKELNEQQKEAVKHVNGPSVILAGAGSGKTRVLVYKVLNLINNHNIPPSLIVMITFTNKAANEMKKRIGEQERLGYVGTFHSFCARVLRIEADKLGYGRNFIIYDDNDQQTLIKLILKEKDIKRYKPGYFINRISAAKNQLITPDRYLKIFSDFSASQVAEIYSLYQKALKKNNAFDFDDLIMRTTELFIKDRFVLEKYHSRYRYFLIDEFQDTNYAQYVLTRLLGEKYKEVTVVGDFSQSIYSWRGADIRNLEKFQEDFPQTKIFNLEENYRSTQKILDFAYKIISANQTHPVLDLFTNKNQGSDVSFNEVENEEQEALFIASEIEKLKEYYPYSSLAVLYRTNAQSRVIEEVFLHYGFPYLLIGGTRFYERKEIKDILSYLRLLINPNEKISRERIMKLGKRRWESFKKVYEKLSKKIDLIPTSDLMEEIFQETNYLDLYDPHDEEDYSRIENIKELKSVAVQFPQLTQFLEQVALVESEYSDGEMKKKNYNGVRLMTLHQAKGLEFSVVFIAGVEDGILPHSRSMEDHYQIEEERRLFYVGITRAKERLYIINARKRFIFGKRGETIKSRFLETVDY